jgi:peptidoglycan/xylan/chitin deacetylase (PgdA/CDA1 family)
MILYLFVLIVVLMGLYWLFMSSWSQFFGYFPYRIRTNEKVIALTFDDGPNEPHTTNIAKYLHDQGVPATFFQVADCIERFPGVSKKVLNLGHVVGNHSTHHQFRRHLIDPSFDYEIDNAQATITKATGLTPALFRPPWLWRTPFLLKNLKSKGLIPVSGEFCHSLEIFQPSAERIARAVLRKARPGVIIIFHDGVEGRTGDRNNTYESLKIIVPSLKKQGYKFLTIDKLLGVKPYK